MMFNKKIFTLFVVYSFILCVFSAKIYADTLTAASCSYNDVCEAISAASPGDTVNVPAGNCTWNSSLLIIKGINLIGAGIGNTVIKNNSGGGLGFEGGYWLQYNPSNYDLNSPFRLSGFTFDLAKNSKGFALGQPGKSAPFTVQTQVRIDNNLWINPPSGAGAFIWNACGMYGVVDNNTFTGSWYPFKNDSQTWPDEYWDQAPNNVFVSGSGNYIYFEDNIINLSGPGDNLLSEAQYSARYAFRYNTITTSVPSYSLFEMHGEQASGSMGACFGAEVYGNQISASSNQIVLFKVRSGRSFVFYNNIDTSGSVSNVAYDGLGICPKNHAADKVIHDTYWWQSRKNKTGALISASASGSVDCIGLENIPKLGRDVFSDNSNPGVGCGSSLPESCTTGEGYWYTTQSCSDLSGMVGANPTTPISGTLYKCTATNTWTKFYTPYTYPHPLRMGGILDPPTRLRIVD